MMNCYMAILLKTFFTLKSTPNFRKDDLKNKTTAQKQYSLSCSSIFLWYSSLLFILLLQGLLFSMTRKQIGVLKHVTVLLWVSAWEDRIEVEERAGKCRMRPTLGYKVGVCIVFLASEPRSHKYCPGNQKLLLPHHHTAFKQGKFINTSS